MAAALAAISAYIHLEAEQQVSTEQNRWSLAGRLDAQMTNRQYGDEATGWGRRHVR
jgi:hypothetical protein